MSIYVKVWSNKTSELIYVKSGWRKKRYHFLINPKDKNQILSPEGEINYESITHVIALKTPSENEDFFKKIAEISEWLNKPIITTQDDFSHFREYGVPINQLRSIEAIEEIFHEIKLKNVKYEKSIFDPKNETVRPTVEARKSTAIEEIIPETIYGFVGFAVKPFQFLTKLIFSTFRKRIRYLQLFQTNRLNAKKEQPSSDDIPEENICLFCNIGKRTLLLPLDHNGVANAKKAIDKYEPEICVISDLNLIEVFSYPEGPKTLVLLDSKYDKEEPTFIPKAFNPQLPFDVILSGKNQWVELT